MSEIKVVQEGTGEVPVPKALSRLVDRLASYLVALVDVLLGEKGQHPLGMANVPTFVVHK